MKKPIFVLLDDAINKRNTHVCMYVYKENFKLMKKNTDMKVPTKQIYFE